ncbi:MAG: L-rhamnose mutarotase [Mycobacteriales bacterium]|jgi:L-rhamnose mutarotase
MPEIALHTRLRPESVAEYESVHRAVPADLLAALRAAGVRNWRIWRAGTDLFHLVDVEDYARMRHALRDHPANVAWQARVVPLHRTPDDYAGTDAGLPLLWSLTAQLAAAADPDSR